MDNQAELRGQEVTRAVGSCSIEGGLGSLSNKGVKDLREQPSK